MFSQEELKTPFIINQISLKADILAGNKAGIPENLSVSQWNNKQANDFRFYFTNFKSAILEGLFPEIEEEIRISYKNKVEELNYITMIEESFYLPDYMVPLKVYIERSCQAKNILMDKHREIIIKAISDGLKVPENVLKDYREVI